jgi:hypothetical protein
MEDELERAQGDMIESAAAGKAAEEKVAEAEAKAEAHGAQLHAHDEASARKEAGDKVVALVLELGQLKVADAAKLVAAGHCSSAAIAELNIGDLMQLTELKLGQVKQLLTKAKAEAACQQEAAAGAKEAQIREKPECNFADMLAAHELLLKVGPMLVDHKLVSVSLLVNDDGAVDVPELVQWCNIELSGRAEAEAGGRCDQHRLSRPR